MWTDEQLTEQGWSVEQIATYRTEEASQAVTAAAERVISETIISEPAHPEKMLRFEPGPKNRELDIVGTLLGMIIILVVGIIIRVCP